MELKVAQLRRGYSRSEVEKLCDFQHEMSLYIEKNRDNLSFLQIFGLLISFIIKLMNLLS